MFNHTLDISLHYDNIIQNIFYHFLVRAQAHKTNKASNMIAQVISLVSETKRRKHIEDMFSNLSIDYQFFDAIDKKVAIETCHNEGLVLKEDSLTLGELGCFMSHYLLWKQIIDADLPYMLIFEDDVIVSPKICDFIANIEDIMSQFQAIHLETMMMKSVYEKESIRLSGFEFLKLKTAHMGLAGYVLTQEMAKLLIDSIQKNGVNKPIDHYLCLDIPEKRQGVDFYQITPALVIQEDVLNQDLKSELKSSLEIERKQRMRRKEKNQFKKLVREIKRLCSQFTPKYWQEKQKQQQIHLHGTVIPFDRF